ncbi:hypothetical protein CYMTET_46202 [Cymbomonas tetramitiformis]|uniref:Uncharacterized protein n=1 Tax=Cymbomonas tetramitiformis TaxID=36881 RepID=A0AAE0BXT7_9CHLO|nr:hypothetical protein CYMTET_46202 [Cymbomonas tetramitiformis]
MARAAQQAAGGTKMVDKIRVGKQYRITMQLATRQNDPTGQSATSPRRGGAVPGKRAVLRPLQQVAGKENVPEHPTPPPSKGTRILLSSWGGNHKEPEKMSKTTDKENQAPPPEAGYERRGGPLEAVKCKPRIRRDPNTGIRLLKAKHRKRDKALKAAAVFQEMLAIDKATGEAPNAALLEETMAEQQEEGDHDHVGEGSRTKAACVEREDPRGWA